MVYNGDMSEIVLSEIDNGKLRLSSDERKEFEREFEEMALDEDVQREIAQINHEFMVTEMDGLA